MEWVSVKDRLPTKNGEYLVVKTFFGYRKIDVAKFALNLNSIDDYDFHKVKRSGFYEFDDETGYFEWTGITHWAELPEFPEE